MTDLEKRFLKNTDDTGRFIYQSLVTGRNTMLNQSEDIQIGEISILLLRR